MHIGNLNEMCRHVLSRAPFDFAALRSGRAVREHSVRAERNPQGEVEASTALSTNDLGKLYKEGRSDVEYLAFPILFPGSAWEHSPNGAYLMRVSTMTGIFRVVFFAYSAKAGICSA